jgi:hypothetical protein
MVPIASPCTQNVRKHDEEELRAMHELKLRTKRWPVLWAGLLCGSFVAGASFGSHRAAEAQHAEREARDKSVVETAVPYNLSWIAACTASDGVAVIRLIDPRGVECTPSFALETAESIREARAKRR